MSNPAVYFTVQEAATILKKSRQQVWTYITKLDDDRKLKAKRVDGHWYIHPDDLNDFIERFRAGKVFYKSGCGSIDNSVSPKPIPEIKYR